MSNLKQKTISGLTWSFIDNIAGRGIAFVIGIILARLLTPSEFGLIGMITIFIAISHSFIDSGFSQAIIRKKNLSENDLSTVFYFNLTVGLLFYILLFFGAPYVAVFFKEPLLKDLLRVLALAVILDAFSIIQRTILIRRIDFKLQTKISVIANAISGATGIFMAYNGYGVWSLIVQTLLKSLINTVLLWLWNKWMPALIFSLSSFKDLFAFGSKLLLVGLIDTIYKNIYYLIIGRFFSAAQLGYYTRAQQFSDLPSTNITGVIQRVSYPVLSQIQDDAEGLKKAYKKLIKSTMLITFGLMMGMAAIAEPLIITLIGEKWQISVIYLQLLCFVGMMYPLHALNLNMLNVKGRSDLFLKLEIIKKTLAVPVIVIGIYFGIKIMIFCMIINTLIAYILNSFWSGKLVQYPIKEQVADILPSFLLASFVGIFTLLAGFFLPFEHLPKLFIQIGFGTILFISSCEILRFDTYLEIKEILLNKINTFRKK